MYYERHFFIEMQRGAMFKLTPPSFFAATPGGVCSALSSLLLQLSFFLPKVKPFTCDHLIFPPRGFFLSTVVERNILHGGKKVSPR